MQYYYHKDGQQIGPITLEELRQADITPETLIWHEGLPTWQKAGELAELEMLFSPSDEDTPQLPHQELETTPHQVPKSERNPHRNQGLIPPPNYLVWSILVTILCCWPLGIPAIVYSSKVNAAFFNDQVEDSLRYSKLARNWIIASAVVGLVGIAIYIIFLFIGIISINEVSPFLLDEFFD